MQGIRTIDIKNLEVETELDCGDVMIKLFKIPFGYQCNRNIIGENKRGEMIWQVEDAHPPLDASFTNIRPFNEMKIITYNWIGADYYIDIQTGRLELVNGNARLW